MKEVTYECGNGWFDIIDEAIKEMKKINPTCVISQVKEKYGDLCIYYWCEQNTLDSTRIALEKVVSAAEAKARQTCEMCGSTNSEVRNSNIGGWYKTVCPRCFTDLR